MTLAILTRLERASASFIQFVLLVPLQIYPKPKTKLESMFSHAFYEHEGVSSGTFSKEFKNHCHFEMS